MSTSTRLAYSVAFVGLMAAVSAEPASADHNSLHLAPCNEPATVGGGELGVSPGPISPQADRLGWDVGSGQCNGSFTVTEDFSFPSVDLDGIELGMRAEQRRVGQVARNTDLPVSGAGDYTVQTGPDTTPPTALDRAWWNIQHSIAYDGNIDALDGLVWSIRTDVGDNTPTAPVFDLLAISIDARQSGTEPNSTYTDLYQASQNPEFGWFTHPNDDDGNNTGRFDYNEAGAWMMTLAAAEDGALASVNICIHTPTAACIDQAPLVYTCTGFEPPLDKPVVVRKKARVLPLKMICTDDLGNVLTDADLSAPVVQVHKTGDAADTIPADEVTSAGKGTEGNEFVFDGNKFWQFNLDTKQITAEGDYQITALPSGGDVLVGAPEAEVTFE